MSIAFGRARELLDQRVRMVFDDGGEVVATLLFATEDLDGSQHLIYDRVEWTNDASELVTAPNATLHAEGDVLVSIEPESRL
jgi:hypothetical protein